MTKTATTKITRKPTPRLQWYQRRKGAALVVVLALIGCYGMVSLAINSGALLQYFAGLALLILAINRMAHIVVVSVTGKPHNG